jgi:hypothetical protein
VVTDWPVTRQERDEVWERLTSGMFVLSNANSQERRVRGLAWLLDWLADQPGETWQQRWMASGADALGGAWRQVPGRRDLRRSCPSLAGLPGGRRGRQGRPDPQPGPPS